MSAGGSFQNYPVVPRPGWVYSPVGVSIMLFGCTTWTLTKRLEKKPDGNYTRML